MLACSHLRPLVDSVPIRYGQSRTLRSLLSQGCPRFTPDSSETPSEDNGHPFSTSNISIRDYALIIYTELHCLSVNPSRFSRWVLRTSCQDAKSPARYLGCIDHLLRDRQYFCRFTIRVAHLCCQESWVTRLFDVVRMGMSSPGPCIFPCAWRQLDRFAGGRKKSVIRTETSYFR